MSKTEPQRRLPPINDYERTVLKNVDEHGWHCTSVVPTKAADGQVFSYTVGLHQTYGTSELILFGLPSDTAHAIFSIIADRLREANPISLHEPTNDLIQNYPCMFVAVPRERYNDFVLSALWFYAETSFPLHQVVYPDRGGLFPWHPQASPAFREQQPVLGSAQCVLPDL